MKHHKCSGENTENNLIVQSVITDSLSFLETAFALLHVKFLKNSTPAWNECAELVTVSKFSSAPWHGQGRILLIWSHQVSSSDRFWLIICSFVQLRVPTKGYQQW